MPLDTGAVTEFGAIAGASHLRMRAAAVVLDPNGNVGAALRAARKSLGLAVEDIALVTRVRASHVAAIEAFDIDALPSRPFAIGYVRAYARALGLDAEAVVARFKAQAPAPDSDLRPPMGIDHRAPGRLGPIMLIAGAIILAVATWNFTRRLMAPPAHPARAELSAAARPAPRLTAGPAHLGGPLPAPPEATTPAPYETPGLAAAAAANGSADAAEASARDARAVAASHVAVASPVGGPFVAAGTIYGAPAGGPGLILQAVKPTSLVIHGQDGTVYFAREMAAGEAWRAPPLGGLTADVGNPASIEVFVGGLSHGPLSAPKTPLAKLGG